MSTLNTNNIKHASSTESNIQLKSNGGVGNFLVSNPGEINYIEVGHAQTGDYSAYIDLIGDTTYNDYGLRFIRNGGANQKSQIEHRGTANLIIKAKDANGQVVIQNFAPQIAQAFVNFNGGATGTIYSSYNVSSVTDNGVGNYTINFTSNIIEKDHSSQDMPAVFAQSVGPVNVAHCHCFPSGYQDGQVDIQIYRDVNSNDKADGNPVSVIIYG